MANWYLTRPAQNNLNDIIANVVEFTGHTLSGIRLQEEIYERLDLLTYFPESGLLRKKENCREIIFRGYRIVYDIRNDDVVVIAIIHSSRLYPRPSGQF